MYYIHCLELINECVDNGILQQVEPPQEFETPHVLKQEVGYIHVCRNIGGESKWGLIDKQELASELIDDEVGQTTLIEALKEKGVVFIPKTDVDGLKQLIELIK